MEYVDWIVSFVIFIFVILMVITAIPKFLPNISNKEDIYTSKMIYSQLLENIPTYNIYCSNDKGAFFLKNENQRGRANTSYVQDHDMVYGVANTDARFYDFEADTVRTKTPILKTEFVASILPFIQNDGSQNIEEGEMHITANSKLDMLNSLSNVESVFTFKGTDLNIYFNYVNGGETSLCQFKEETLSLYDINQDGSFLKSQTIVSFKDENWKKITVSSNYTGKASCKLNEYVIESTTQSSVNDGMIRLINQDPYVIGSFDLYEDNYLRKKLDRVETRYFDVVTNNNSATIENYLDGENVGSISVLYPSDVSNNLVEDNMPGIIVDESNDHRMVIFPNTEELFIIVDKYTDYFFEHTSDISVYDYTENELYLENSELGKYITLYFYNINNEKSECEYKEIDKNNFKLTCSKKTYIRYKLGTKMYLERTLCGNYKTKETLITSEKIESLLNNYQEDMGYYIKIYNNKEKIKIGEDKYSGDFKLLEKVSKYLTNEGKEEIVKVLIKPN